MAHGQTRFFPDALLCDNVSCKLEQPPPTVVEYRTEHILQQYPAHLASSVAFGVMLHVYRDLTPRLFAIRIFDPAGGPQCHHIFASLVRHDKVSLVSSISLTIADCPAHADVRY